MRPLHSKKVVSQARRSWGKRMTGFYGMQIQRHDIYDKSTTTSDATSSDLGITIDCWYAQHVIPFHGCTVGACSDPSQELHGAFDLYLCSVPRVVTCNKEMTNYWHIVQPYSKHSHHNIQHMYTFFLWWSVYPQSQVLPLPYCSQ